MSITLAQYFIGRTHSTAQSTSANDLLNKVNALLYDYTLTTGNEVQINPATNSLISGVTEGGFRLPECTQGAPNSSHKQAQAVDIHDEDGELDKWITDKILAQYNLWREAPEATEGWAHLTTRPQASYITTGRRTFFP